MLLLSCLPCFPRTPANTVPRLPAVPSVDTVPRISSPPLRTARRPTLRVHRHTALASDRRAPVPGPSSPARGREFPLPDPAPLPLSLAAPLSSPRSSQNASLRLVFVVSAATWQPTHQDPLPAAPPLPRRFPSAAQFSRSSPSSSALSYLVPFLHSWFFLRWRG